MGQIALDASQHPGGDEVYTVDGLKLRCKVAAKDGVPDHQGVTEAEVSEEDDSKPLSDLSDTVAYIMNHCGSSFKASMWKCSSGSTIDSFAL